MRKKEAEIIQEALDMIGGILLAKRGEKKESIGTIPALSPEFREEDHEYLKPLLDDMPKPRKEEAKKEVRPAGPVRIVIRSQASAAEPR